MYKLHVIWDGALCWSVMKPIMPACINSSSSIDLVACFGGLRLRKCVLLCVSMYVCTCIYVYMLKQQYQSGWLFRRLCMGSRFCKYICMYMYMCVCICICIYICIYIYVSVTQKCLTCQGNLFPARNWGLAARQSYRRNSARACGTAKQTLSAARTPHIHTDYVTHCQPHVHYTFTLTIERARHSHWLCHTLPVVRTRHSHFCYLCKQRSLLDRHQISVFCVYVCVYRHAHIHTHTKHIHTYKHKHTRTNKSFTCILRSETPEGGSVPCRGKSDTSIDSSMLGVTGVPDTMRLLSLPQKIVIWGSMS